MGRTRQARNPRDVTCMTPQNEPSSIVAVHVALTMFNVLNDFPFHNWSAIKSIDHTWLG
ncbi:MAG: hypothetical protein ACI85V_002489 [bacterium]